MSSSGRKWFFFTLLLFGIILSVIAKIDFDFIKELHEPLSYPNGTKTSRDNGSAQSKESILKQSTLESDNEIAKRSEQKGDSEVDLRFTQMSDNEIDGRSTQTIIDEAQNMIEEFIKKGFEKANEILLQQKRAAASSTRSANFINFHAPAAADVSIQHASDCRGLGMLETSKLIAEHFKISRNEADDTLQAIIIPEGICKSIETKCFSTGRHLTRQADFGVVPCDPQFKYRNVDGTCNNLRNPKLGASGTIFSRFLNPAYADGVNSPSVSKSGQPLPNPRQLSNALFNSNSNPAPNEEWTQLLKGWGQFLDHDISRTPESVVLNSAGDPQSLVCCDDGNFPTTPVAPDCRPIDVRGDSFYRSNGISCLRFVRSLASDCGTCNLRSRTQVNAITHFIDASQIYGSNFLDQQNLRSFQGGRLAIANNILEQGRCPAASTSCELSFLSQEILDSKKGLEFVSGDARVNEQPGLTCLHAVFSRYHNNLAFALSSINPQWNDEKIYQEARRIVGALMQQITYSEFLPIVLGRTIMQANNLIPITQGFFSYNSSVDPSIAVEFATAAYRFGHTLIGNNLMGANGRLIPLRNSYFDDSITKKVGQSPSQIMQGELIMKSEEFDVNLVSAIRNFLFASPPSFIAGLDLMALNIMRGRDHGLPGYNSWRRFCGLPTFASFNDLINSGVMNINAAQAFASLYQSVDDIDIYPAGLAENPAVSGFLGPTFACMVGRQFEKLRFGDRFWYENGNVPSSFTGLQLFHLKRTTLASIICETTRTSNIQPFAMLTTIFAGNAIQPCSNIAQISLLRPSNLAAWKA